MKKRVLHIYRKMDRGGAETFIMNVYRKIDREKFQFDFLCTEREAGDYDDEIKTMGGNIYYIDMPSKRHPIRNINQLISIMKEKGPYDAIHIPLMFYSGIVSMAARMAKIPQIIVHSHSSSDRLDKGKLRSIYVYLMRKLINIFSTAKIACGLDAGEFLFGSDKDVIIMNNGIDIDKFQEVPEEKTGQLKKEFKITDEILIGNIARFTKEKNQQFLVDMAKWIKTNNINAKIIMVGSGEMLPDIKASINENKLEDICILPGVRTDIPEILSIFDVLVMPSIYEGFPLTIVEALATGTPCVLSSNIPKETALINNMVSFLSINDDKQNWYDEIIAKVESNDKNKVKIKEQLVEKGFDINKTVKQLSKIYMGNDK